VRFEITVVSRALTARLGVITAGELDRYAGQLSTTNAKEYSAP
jgi:hypothetical protein